MMSCLCWLSLSSRARTPMNQTQGALRRCSNLFYYRGRGDRKGYGEMGDEEGSEEGG